VKGTPNKPLSPFLLLLSGRLHRSYRSESAITVFLTLAGDRAVLEDALSRESVANGPIAAPVASALFPDILQIRAAGSRAVTGFGMASLLRTEPRR
jgi:hypothetical protein